mgnify:CR=1 FL=1
MKEQTDGQRLKAELDKQVGILEARRRSHQGKAERFLRDNIKGQKSSWKNVLTRGLIQLVKNDAPSVVDIDLGEAITRGVNWKKEYEERKNRGYFRT